ncbi:unnamed protein product [Cladocopium goreaui]|uniref:1,3-beta-glucan synthase n=1 Tax=Cladocopium goreaui TaxID=2562237 RepID=A0A9P1C8R4_9DINO|nr:unnamed protein product [Cladocopium goreaui]
MGAVTSLGRSELKYAVQIHPPVHRSLSELTEQMVTVTGAVNFCSSSWQRPGGPSSALQDFAANPLLQPPLGESWVSGPCVLEIDDYVHLWVGISSGILHLVSHDGLSTWTAVEMTVDCPGASRASVTREPKSNVVYLFYEQTDPPQHGFTSTKVKLISAKLPSAAFSAGTGCGVKLRRFSSRNWSGRRCKWQKWLLYYSASSVFRRKDSKNPPPMYIGIAAAPAVEGPYRRINEKPFLGTSEGVPQVIGAGSFKMIKGFDVLNYDEEAGIGRRLLALESRITRSKDSSVSSIALLASADGFSWSLIDANFLAPSAEKSWKKANIHTFDTMIPSFDPDHVFIYYDARDNFKKSTECVGVARIPVVFLESIACTTATRVGAT